MFLILFLPFYKMDHCSPSGPPQGGYEDLKETHHRLEPLLIRWMKDDEKI